MRPSGDPSDPTALLIMGLGMQMVAWHDDFCLALAERGLHVVRFDNRDAGQSTHMEGPAPTLLQLWRRSAAPARYTLADMAEDASGLLRELGLGRAHVIGASMGGMIAQLLAIRHPEQVSSLTSIMSNTGNRRVGQPALSIYPVFLRRAPRDSEAFLEHSVRFFRTIGSPMLNLDQRELREIAARSYAREHDATASGRQLAAIIASPDRTPELRSLRVPTLVIHGSADRLVQPSGGKATARAIPGARMLEIDGMGHDLPRVVWPRMIDAIVENGAREPVEAAAEQGAVPGEPYSRRRRRQRARCGPGPLRRQRACAPRPLGPIRALGDFQVAHNHAPDDQDVAVAEVALGNPLAVDECPVEAPIVEDPHARTAVDEDRMPSRDRCVVEPQVGRESAADVQDARLKRYQDAALGALDLQVAPGLCGGRREGILADPLVEARHGVQRRGGLFAQLLWRCSLHRPI